MAHLSHMAKSALKLRYSESIFCDTLVHFPVANFGRSIWLIRVILIGRVINHSQMGKIVRLTNIYGKGSFLTFMYLVLGIIL